MNPKYDIYEEIDRYLSGELSEAELDAFNKKLSTDAEFKSIVDAQKLANEIIIDQEMIKLKARMNKEMNADNMGSGPWGKLLILSAVVVTSAALYTYINYSSSDKEEDKKVLIDMPLAIHVPPTKEQTKEAESISKEKVNSIPSSKEVIDSKFESTTIVPSQEKKTETIVPVTETIPVFIPQKEEVKQAATAVEQLAKVNCATVHITAQVRVDYGFGNDGEATIIIDELSVKGGKAPYSYSIDQSAFDGDARISGIKDGTYHVRIKDGNHCVSEIKKEIVVKTPVKEIDEAFAPAHGERWKFPLKPSADANITIYNKAGVTVYTTPISGGYPEEWDGKTNAGVELESGNYYFAIQYSARDVVRGHISIVK
ncbi:MAG: hypothetical protein K0R51_393 [Cytophagaceae bacterium]|jgi:hypothetical protein|nr:hypothetical protein [Cytophagaceae bacterium]